MGLKADVAAIMQGNDQIAYRPSQVFAVGIGAYTIFSINGGAILAKALVGRITAVAVGATTIATTLNGVAGEAAGVACDGAVGLIVWVPLDVAGTLTNIGAQPCTDALFAPKGMIVGTQPAGPGLIVATYGVGTSLTMEWTLIYTKLSPASEVS